ncbi:MAG: radical SAM protein, partial [Coriobacteriales bacterium]
IVHVARGVPWCKPEDEVVAEVRAAEAAGAGEVVLSGINLGSVDDLGGLLERLLAATSHVRVRLSSIEPCDVTDHLVDVLASCSGRVCRHLHIPLQSGCDETLREMARPYDTAFFSRLVSSLREQVPSIALTTDVMAGFPGESDEQFEQSLSFCAEMACSKMHVFRYSRRPGTPAATRLDQVEPQVKATRARRLRKLSEQMRRTYAASLLGTRETVLVESAGRATAERYLPCVSADGTSFGHDADGRGLVPVEVVGTRDETLVCQRLAVL